MTQASPPEVTPRRSVSPASPDRTRRVVSAIVAAALLAGAIFAVSRYSDQLHLSLRAAADAPLWLIASALVLPLANWFIMSLLFWVLTRRFGRVGLGEMACLIGAAGLLNYLPMRPGLLGRIAYHKTVNAIPVRDSIRVSIWSIACAAVAIGVLLIACLGAAAISSRPDVHLLIVGAAPTMALGMLTVGLRSGPWRLALAVLLRYLDVLVWTARYAVVFAIIGHPISWPGAGAIAGIVQVAMLVPLVGNGLGLREWTVGLTSGLLPKGVVTIGGSLTTTIGLAADLANRAAEVCCAVPLGLTCAFLLARRKP